MEKLFQEKVSSIVKINIRFDLLNTTIHHGKNCFLLILHRFQILELAQNKKSEHLLNLQSQINDDEGISTNENHYDYCVKLENKLQYDSNKRDEELEMCLEEIEKNLTKLRY